MNKKKIFVLALVLIMLATISFSTLAWFTDADSAENKFTIGGAGKEDPDQIFSVDVKEKVDGEEKPVDKMDFEKILPGDKFKKEAYITNTGSYEQYIRVTLTISDWNLIKDLITINMDDSFANNWMIATRGVTVNRDGNLVTDHNVNVDRNGNLVVVLYLNHKLEPGKSVDILDYVSVSSRATQEDFTNKAFLDGFSIEIKADAAQTENILPNYARDESANAQRTFEILEAE